MSSGELTGQKFAISSELGEAGVVPVTGNDCIKWSQSFDFNNVARSINLALHFKITSLSGSLGTVIKRFGINPWDLIREGNQYKGFDITGLPS